ncbi:MAG: hypothetical protein IKW01_04595 [Firmicutes bacterium]|nr:hypothetical protein [Bacillota bacterium]
MLYKSTLEEMRTKLEKRIEFVRKAIDACPPGYLLKTKRDNRYEYIHMYYEKGQRKRKRIKLDSMTMKGLLEKRILEFEISILERNYRIVCEAAEKFTAFSAGQDYGEVMGILSEEYYEIVFSNAKEVNNGAGPNQSGFRPEGKTHITSRGLAVRSKSELLIAEKLYEHGIMFWYEEVMELGKFSVAPDFTVKRKDGELVYWEHCGLTGDTKYMAHHRWKMTLYEGVGIVPWKNLIVTYDDEKGRINMAVVESEIRNKILV